MATCGHVACPESGQSLHWHSECLARAHLDLFVKISCLNDEQAAACQRRDLAHSDVEDLMRALVHHSPGDTGAESRTDPERGPGEAAYEPAGAAQRDLRLAAHRPDRLSCAALA